MAGESTGFEPGLLFQSKLSFFLVQFLLSHLRFPVQIPVIVDPAFYSFDYFESETWDVIESGARY